MKIGLRIEFKNGDKCDTVAEFEDFIAFEKTRRKSVTRLQNEMELTDLAWLAWNVEKRHNKTQLPFEPQWVATVAMVTPIDDESTATLPLDS